MEYLSTNASEINFLLNEQNDIYKDDIDIKIIHNGDIVGFIISSSNPIRFVGVKDFGCSTDSFDDYRLYIKATSLDIIYNDVAFSIPAIQIKEASATRPYISNKENFIIPIGETSDIVFTGGIFDPSIEIDLGSDIVVNHITSVTPDKIVFNVTSSDTKQDPCVISMFRNGLYHYGEHPTIEVDTIIVGQGPLGTFTTDFNNGLTGEDAWGDKWKLEISKKIDSLDGYFQTSDRGTPSNGTGPSSPHDSFYMFTEGSGDNSGKKNIATATTSYFNDITKIEFRYHMFGDGMGDLKLECQKPDKSWVCNWIQKGAYQTSQSDIFKLITLNTEAWSCIAIRFVFENSTSYASDCAIDNIIITSI